ncbi:MAG: deoxyribodipyrimidine photo-lyase, partial [Chloroflexi bacterium]|nr:deoxyribodipyrimidine photo-lyase [Chloroflexota bacterium]
MAGPVVVHWFRRDLRLADNLALRAALDSGARIVPVFIFDPAILRSPRTGAPRLKFLLAGLRALDANLREHGSRLLIRHGDPRTVLPDLVRELGADGLDFNRDYSPFALRRDADVSAALDIPVHSFDDAVLRAPGDLMKDDGTPYTVYSPFKKRLRALEPPLKPVSSAIPAGQLLPAGQMLHSDEIPTLYDLGFEPTIAVPEAGEAAAQRALDVFLDGRVYDYKDTRNRLVINPFGDDPPVGASYLSHFFRLGMLSPRQAYWAGAEAIDHALDKDAAKSVSAWVDEVIWREFYMHILYHFPHVDRGNFRREYDALVWRDAPEEFVAWQEGRTGYPVVDAAMRQLRAIGWLPNRARMVVASFLTKDLFIHWQAGELHFMQWLIDGDPAANNGGWQWAAGTGTDAQPYFRIFNPISQGRKFDPDGDYVRYWVPELRDVPTATIHAPWEADDPPHDYP